jgi:hypothetical protein
MVLPTMQYSENVESWPRRDPREHDIQINVQPPGTWQAAASSGYSRGNHDNQNGFEFDFRRDPQQYSWDGRGTPNNGWSTPNGRVTPSDGRATPTTLLPQRPALGMTPVARYDTYRASPQFYPESGVSSRVGSPGPQWQNDSRMGSQVNLLHYGTPTPPVSILWDSLWTRGLTALC